MAVRGSGTPPIGILRIIASAMIFGARSMAVEQELRGLPDDFLAWLRAKGLVDLPARAYLFDESFDEDTMRSRLSDLLRSAGATDGSWHPRFVLLMQIARGEAPTASHRIGQVSGMQISADVEVASRKHQDR